MNRFINRPALGVFPGENYPQRVYNSLLRVAPKGHTEVCSLIAKYIFSNAILNLAKIN
jgi:4-aminobutyrate aminotransferase/(S)-3-amino-2-methylpropionate transaminase